MRIICPVPYVIFINMCNIVSTIQTTALIFFLVSSSDTYKLTGSIHNGIANENGCPSMGGINKIYTYIML
jgi:hypothetical protein